MKRIVSVLLALIICFSLCVPAFAEKVSAKTVVVGYFQREDFEEGKSDDDVKSGYAYEYMQAVANYAGWTYKYIYGDWSDLYQMLINGEIDIMAGISYTESANAQISFPDVAMGQETHYIYKSNNSSIRVNDVASLQGKTIASVKNSALSTELKQWSETNGISISIAEYGSYDECYAALNNGEVAGLIESNNNMAADSKLTSAFKVATCPYYLCVSKDRSDLLDDLNNALNEINEVDSYFIDDLQNKYFKNASASTILTSVEQEWLSGHDTIKVGYFDNYLPYSDCEDGEATGLVIDIIPEMLKNLGLTDKLKVEYYPYTNGEEMIEDVKTGAIDVAFPMSENIWRAEQNGLSLSSSFLQTTCGFVYKGSYSAENSVKKIAVNEGNVMQYYYIVENFPDAEVVYCKDTYACFKAVLSGKVDGTIVNGLRVSALLGHSKYKELSSVEMNKKENYCFAVAEGNVAVLKLLNHGINSLSENYAASTCYKYMGGLSKYTFSDFVNDNSKYLIIIFLIILVALLSYVEYRIQQSKKQAEKDKQLQDELSDALSQARHASDAKTTFLNSMSHDIRTPMNAIIGFTQLAQNHIDEKKQVEDYLSKISSSSNHLLHLINDMLDMSRIESGRIKLDEEEHYIPAMLENLRNILQEEANAKQLRLEIDYDKVMDKYVFCDELRLNQIFLNCLGNSIKFTEAGGLVSVTVLQKFDAPNGYAHYDFILSDTGIGMSQDFVDHIFEPFSREESSMVSKITGTGLGMSITKNLVDMMGGTITVKSEKGKGSEFTISIQLKVAETKEVEDTPQAEIRTDFTGSIILLVEDNDLNMEIATEILEETGVTVEQAHDGQEAVNMVDASEENHYDLILMDVQMPIMNGYEATKAIRELDRKDARTLPIVAMTANAFMEDRKMAFDAGMNDHIAKPIDLDKLYGVMGQFL